MLLSCSCKNSAASLLEYGHSETRNTTFFPWNEISSSAKGMFDTFLVDLLGRNESFVGDVMSGLSHWKSKSISFRVFCTQITGLGRSLFCSSEKLLWTPTFWTNSASKSLNAFSCSSLKYVPLVIRLALFTVLEWKNL